MHDAESLRLAKLRSFAILDTPEEKEFDTIVALAQRLLGCPVVLVSLVDDHRQWFKARCGVDATETPRDIAFCAHAMLGPDIMVVEDATRDPRFADNPLVTGPLGIRFYAGVPLRPAAPGFDDSLPGIGTLCVIDTKPRTLSDADMALLRELGALAAALIEARAAAATALRLSEEAADRAMMLDRQHRLLLQAERMAGIGSWRIELGDDKVEWSDQVFAIHGLPVGTPPSLERALDFYPEEDRARVTDLIGTAISRAEPFSLDSDLVAADGRLLRVRSLGEPEYRDGEPVAIIGVFQDITDQHAREQQLRATASTDALTGLPNRACFETRLDAALLRAAACAEPLALLFLDLDGFKSVNDSFGHDAGDEVLRAMAASLRGRDFANAFAARLGGDEFVMLVTRPRDCANMRSFVSNLLRRLRYDVVRDGRLRRVSATVGAAFLEEGATNAAELMRRADLALYDAKRHHRGTGRIYGEDRAIVARAQRTAISVARAA